MLYNSNLPVVPKAGVKISVTTDNAETTSGLVVGAIYSVTNIGAAIAYINVEGVAATDVGFPIFSLERVDKICLPYGSINCLGVGATTLVLNRLIDVDEYRTA